MEPTSEANRTDCSRGNGVSQLAARILCAEDDPVLRGLVAAILCRAGYGVISVENGMRAWAALQLQDFDLLVTDNEMPELSGLELAAMARREGKSLPIIMASSTAARICAERSDLSMVEPLEKPFAPKALLLAVAKALGKVPSPEKTS